MTPEKAARQRISPTVVSVSAALTNPASATTPGRGWGSRSIVKELTEAMGGSVFVESEPGAGSRFVLRLPHA